MPKTSLAERILKSVGKPDVEGPFLLVYDHTEHPSAYFYRNLERIQEMTGDGDRIQASVILCRELRTALALHKLSQHYKAKSMVFKVERIDTKQYLSPGSNASHGSSSSS